jgi:aminomethyltransferase
VSSTPLGERVSAPRVEFRIEPGQARAVTVAAGELVEIEDLEGQQSSDVLAFHERKPGVGISTTVTRALCDGLFPLVGQAYVDGDGNPLLTVLEDDVGRHDTFGVACNREYYAAFGQPDHPNCTDSFNRELAPFGYAPRRFWEPVNLFYNTVIGSDLRIVEVRPPLSKPGDHVVFRAETDLVVSASACPDDISLTNGGRPTPVAFRVRVPEQNA